MNYTFADIEKYVEGQMTPQEAQAFEAACEREAELKEQLEAYMFTRDVLQKEAALGNETAALKEKLTQLTREHFGGTAATSKVVRLRTLSYYMAAAASVVLLLWLTVFYNADEGFTIQPIPGAIVRGNTSDFMVAAQHFNEGAYAQALPAFQKLYRQDSANAVYAYYLGICYLKVGDYRQSCPLLERVANGASAYREDALFFVALCAQKTGDKARAEAAIKKVPPTSPYYKAAQKLLREL